MELKALVPLAGFPLAGFSGNATISRKPKIYQPYNFPPTLPAHPLIAATVRPRRYTGFRIYRPSGICTSGYLQPSTGSDTLRLLQWKVVHSFITLLQDYLTVAVSEKTYCVTFEILLSCIIYETTGINRHRNHKP